MSDSPGSAVAREVPKHLLWAKGGHAAVVSAVEDRVELLSTTTAPPGARLEATLATAPGIALTIKSSGTRREADGVFVLKGKLLVATREVRDAVRTLASLYTCERP